MKRLVPFEWPRQLLLTLVQAYRIVLRPLLGNRCRFDPSCSTYAFEAISSHGAAAGTYLAAARVLRCHPWCASGHDPVPEVVPSLFKSFATRPASSKSRTEVSP